MRRYLKALLVGAILATMMVASPARAEAAQQKFQTSIYGGTISVDYIGTQSNQARVGLLVLLADRTTCTFQVWNSQGGVNCDGEMHPWDRIVVTDHYMAWMDLTRSDQFGGGGGGQLRGLWPLTTSGGVLNFKYYGAAGSGRAPNALFPCQNLTAAGSCSQTDGDGYEILAALPSGNGQEQPAFTYRASSVSTGNLQVFSDGVYNSSNHSTKYHFWGKMTQGYNSSNYTTNIGAPGPLSQMNFNVTYQFYRDRVNVGGSQEYAFDVNVQVDVCGAGACANNTRALNSVVISLGLGATTGSNATPSVRIDQFRPLGPGQMYGDTYNCSATQHPYAVNTLHNYSSMNLPPSQGAPHYAQRKVSPWSLYNIKLDADSFGLSIVNSQMGNHGGISTEAYHQVIRDPGGVNVYDVKWGDENQCGGTLGVLNPGEWLYHNARVGVDYKF